LNALIPDHSGNKQLYVYMYVYKYS